MQKHAFENVDFIECFDCLLLFSVKRHAYTHSAQPSLLANVNMTIHAYSFVFEMSCFDKCHRQW